jgi:hypothetical protein
MQKCQVIFCRALSQADPKIIRYCFFYLSIEMIIVKAKKSCQKALDLLQININTVHEGRRVCVSSTNSRNFMKNKATKVLIQKTCGLFLFHSSLLPATIHQGRGGNLIYSIRGRQDLNNMKEDEKKRMVVLVNHWIAHNQSHTESYIDKARELAFQGLDNAAKEITEASNFVLKANERFEAARAILDE